MIRFELTEDLTTSDASAEGNILDQFGVGPDALIEEGITLLNYQTSGSSYRWEGDSGDIGLAVWHQGTEYVIIDLECP